ncbi:uncharacterized protein SCODWIG_00761 [Saccharomycodes ludwigii]|uniref:TECPR1-like DysF domain-containing protein n=1 Tax=Saccharomycodes ludwigii TaxID=36035 RepID=A0A376B4F5_9ASCO|nr:uncharacterized protein SCODWIG_00761 [Saccharomycodes ludwigii]
MSFLWDSSSSHNNDNGPSATNNNHNGNTFSSAFGSTQKLFTDTLIEKMIYMALPSASSSTLLSSFPTSKENSYLCDLTSFDYRINEAKNRPGLSVQIMSKNFINLNSRLSVPFMLLDEIIKIFKWSNPCYTLTILFIITFIILKPIPALTSLPIFYILFGIMVPAYLKIHKPTAIDPPFIINNPEPTIRGPNIIEPTIVKPVPELSKEFLLNLTDLQNDMALYVVVFDVVNKILNKFAYFVDDPISATMFIILFIIGCFNCLFMKYLLAPVFVTSLIKIFLIGFVWIFTILMHPHYRDDFLNQLSSEETRLRWVTLSNQFENRILQEYDLYLNANRELKLAGIFEIQKFNKSLKIWQVVGFCSDDYSPLSDLRINEINLIKFLRVSKDYYYTTSNSGSRRVSLNNTSPSAATATQKAGGVLPADTNSNVEQLLLEQQQDNETDFDNEKEKEEEAEANEALTFGATESLDDVKPPEDWRWVEDSTWALDLDVRKWAQEELILQFIDIDDEEKWVYDYIPEYNGSNTENSNFKRGNYRRRRWIRLCTRETFVNTKNNTNTRKNSVSSTTDSQPSSAGGPLAKDVSEGRNYNTTIKDNKGSVVSSVSPEYKFESIYDDSVEGIHEEEQKRKILKSTILPKRSLAGMGNGPSSTSTVNSKKHKGFVVNSNTDNTHTNANSNDSDKEGENKTSSDNCEDLSDKNSDDSSTKKLSPRPSSMMNLAGFSDFF